MTKIWASDSKLLINQYLSCCGRITLHLLIWTELIDLFHAPNGVKYMTILIYRRQSFSCHRDLHTFWKVNIGEILQKNTSLCQLVNVMNAPGSFLSTISCMFKWYFNADNSIYLRCIPSNYEKMRCVIL